MDHEVVVRQKMTERYLLNELDSESRDEFEEHFFDCPECAFDVRAGSAFVEHTKNVLAEAREPETAPAAIPTPAPASSRMARLAASGILSVCIGSVGGGRRISEFGYLPATSAGPESSPSLA